MTIVISKIDHHGGQCPWQLFGWTPDNKDVYIKYRDGKLRIRVDDELVFSEKIGPDLDGYFTLEKLLLSGVVKYIEPLLYK